MVHKLPHSVDVLAGTQHFLQQLPGIDGGCKPVHVRVVFSRDGTFIRYSFILEQVAVQRIGNTIFPHFSTGPFVPVLQPRHNPSVFIPIVCCTGSHYLARSNTYYATSVMKLEFDGIEYKAGDKQLLSSIYVKCEKGKVTGLLGRNGCGKSTLLKIVFGALAADIASIRIDGTPIPFPAFRSRLIGYLPQDSLIPHNIRLEQIFKLYGVRDFFFARYFPEINLDEKLSTFSGGYVRLVETILILESGFDFCLLDEPFTGLAPVMVERLKDYIRGVSPAKGILITDHLHRDVMEISDKLYLLTNGKTYVVNSKDDLVARGYLH